MESWYTSVPVLWILHIFNMHCRIPVFMYNNNNIVFVFLRKTCHIKYTHILNTHTHIYIIQGVSTKVYVFSKLWSNLLFLLFKLKHIDAYSLYLFKYLNRVSNIGLLNNLKWLKGTTLTKFHGILYSLEWHVRFTMATWKALPQECIRYSYSDIFHIIDQIKLTRVPLWINLSPQYLGNSLEIPTVPLRFKDWLEKIKD